jgi:PilZ domain-containing protein
LAPAREPMELSHDPSAETSAATHPGVHPEQEVVVWTDPVSASYEPRPIVGVVRNIDEETGRILVDVRTNGGDAASQLGARIVLMAARVSNGIYYRHCDVDFQGSPAPDTSLASGVLLSATDEWRRIERRQAERASVSIALGELQYYPASGGFRRLTATIRNISTSGLLLETSQRLDVDDRLELSIPLLDGKPSLRVRARVVRALVSPASSSVWFAGCRFESLHETEQKRISSAMPRLPAGSPFIG